MEQLWRYRFFIGFFIPFILVKSTTFLQGFCYSLAVLLTSVIGFITFILCSIVFRTERGVFYSFLFFFILFTYGVYALFNFNAYYFLEYIISLFPILSFIFIFSYKEKLVEIAYKKYFIVISFICGILIFLGLLREFLGFNEVILLNFSDTRWVIPLNRYLNYIGVDLSNHFFTNPIGGMLVLGITGVFFYEKLKEKYDSKI